jgi:hypothetical protein
MSAAAEAEVGKIKAGLIEPKALACRSHENRALSAHVDEFHAYLAGKGGTPQHANLTRNRIVRVTALAGAKRLSDLSLSRVQAPLKTIRDEGASLRSVHHYTRAIKALSRWF